MARISCSFTWKLPVNTFCKAIISCFVCSCFNDKNAKLLDKTALFGFQAKDKCLSTPRLLGTEHRVKWLLSSLWRETVKVQGDWNLLQRWDFASSSSCFRSPESFDDQYLGAVLLKPAQPCVCVCAPKSEHTHKFLKPGFLLDDENMVSAKSMKSWTVFPHSQRASLPLRFFCSSSVTLFN